MVEGLDRFADHFASYTDRYALIGGAACDLAMQRAAPGFGIKPRSITDDATAIPP